MRPPSVRAVLAGVLVANSAPHLATAVTGRRHLTPLAGPRSGAGVNAVWGSANLAAGLLLLRGRRPAPGRWGRELLDFEAGHLAWTLWMAASERLLHVNTEPADAG
jgi:hypothetical protein